MGMRSIHLYTWYVYYRWMERIPGGTRENDGLDTGIMGAARLAWEKSGSGEEGQGDGRGVE